MGKYTIRVRRACVVEGWWCRVFRQDIKECFRGVSKYLRRQYPAGKKPPSKQNCEVRLKRGQGGLVVGGVQFRRIDMLRSSRPVPFPPLYSAHKDVNAENERG